MAERRMFHTAVVESDAFLDMTPAAQALYFHIGMHADDDGFVNGPRQVCRTVGAPMECLQELIDGNFILWFDGVCVVKHFRMANTLQNDRIKQLRYPDIAKQIFVQPNKIYTLEPGKRKENLYFLRADLLKRKGKRLDSKCIPKGTEQNRTEQKGTEQNRIEPRLREGNRTETPAGGGEGAARDVRPDTPTTYDDDREDKKASLVKGRTSNSEDGGVDDPITIPEEQGLKLSVEQLTKLYEIMGFQNAVRYIDKLSRFIKERNADIKDHYATIRKWWEEDGGTYL